MPEFLQPDLQQVLSQAISFLLLLFILKRFAWKPLLSVIDRRQEQIAQDLRHAEERKLEMERLQEEYRRRLTQIEDEARAKIQQAIADGRKIATEIQEQARAQAQAVLAKAKETVELELDKARVTLRDQMATMTMEAVERLLRQKIDAKVDRVLVDAILDELEHEGEGSRSPKTPTHV